MYQCHPCVYRKVFTDRMWRIVVAHPGTHAKVSWSSGIKYHHLQSIFCRKVFFMFWTLLFLTDNKYGLFPLNCINIQHMQHLCGVANMIDSPRGIQLFGNTTEMSHLFYYTEQHTTHKIKEDNNNKSIGISTSTTSLKRPLETRVGSAKSEQQVCWTPRHPAHPRARKIHDKFKPTKLRHSCILFSLELFSTIRQFHCWRRHSPQAMTYLGVCYKLF